MEKHWECRFPGNMGPIFSWIEYQEMYTSFFQSLGKWSYRPNWSFLPQIGGSLIWWSPGQHAFYPPRTARGYYKVQGIENPEVDLTHEGPVSRSPKAPSTYAWQKKVELINIQDFLSSSIISHAIALYSRAITEDSSNGYSGAEWLRTAMVSLLM